MVPLQTAGRSIGGWFVLVAITLGPGLAATVLWSPFLVSDRISSLFRDLPPGGSLLSSYLVVLLGASIPYVAGFFLALIGTTNTAGAVTANAILDVVVPVSVAYIAGFPILAGFVLPRIGLDWDPAGYGPGTWAILVVGAVWYAAVFAVPLFLIAVVMALPM